MENMTDELSQQKALSLLSNKSLLFVFLQYNRLGIKGITTPVRFQSDLSHNHEFPDTVRRNGP